MTTELDPHGADEQGNPLGGIVFTNGFGKNSASFQTIASSGNFTNDQNFTQVIEWIDFIGSGMFCLKMCNPDDSNAASLCNHIYDEIGCTYNAVADYNAINGTFTVCDSDDMEPPGIYTGTDGQVTTWFQPQTGAIVPPYTPTQVASSNCQTYASSELFAAAATDSAVATSTSGASATATGASGTGSTASRSGTGSTASATGAASGALATFNAGIAPFFIAGAMTTLATMMTMLA